MQMRLSVAVATSLLTGLASLGLAAPAQAAASGSLAQTGGGTTVTATYSGVTAGNVWICSTSIAAASCTSSNYLYVMGGFGVPLPTSPIAAGTTVYQRATASTTSLPDGTYNFSLTVATPTPAGILDTLTNGVIGTGVTPSGGSESMQGSNPAPVLQQFGKPATGTCDAAQPAMLNIGGAESSGWSESWAEWINGGLGGSVCTRTLVYSNALGRWAVG